MRFSRFSEDYFFALRFIALALRHSASLRSISVLGTASTCRARVRSFFHVSGSGDDLSLMSVRCQNAPV